MKYLKVLALAGLIAGAANGADAATLWANSVEYTPGTGITDPSRKHTDSALGGIDGAFLSLGIGGSAVFSFGQTFTTPIAIIEFNKSTKGNSYEAVKVFGILGNGIPTFLGVVENMYAQAAQGGFVISGNYVFDKLLLTDISTSGKNRDGFDVDAISVTAYDMVAPVPLPAAGVLLAGAVGSLALARRKRRQG